MGPLAAGPSHQNWTSMPVPGPSHVAGGDLPTAHQSSDLAYLQKDFPAISHWPDDMLRAHPVGELARAHAELESKLGRGGQPSLEAQLDNNYQKLGSTITAVAAGSDNQLG